MELRRQYFKTLFNWILVSGTRSKRTVSTMSTPIKTSKISTSTSTCWALGPQSTSHSVLVRDTTWDTMKPLTIVPHCLSSHTSLANSLKVPKLKTASPKKHQTNIISWATIHKPPHNIGINDSHPQIKSTIPRVAPNKESLPWWSRSFPYNLPSFLKPQIKLFFSLSKP